MLLVLFLSSIPLFSSIHSYSSKLFFFLSEVISSSLQFFLFYLFVENDLYSFFQGSSMKVLAVETFCVIPIAILHVFHSSDQVVYCLVVKYRPTYPVAYSEPCQISNIEFFAKIVNR